MSTIKIKHVSKPHQNAAINIPIDGNVQVVDGVAEVSGEAAALLLKHAPSEWKLVDEDENTQYKLTGELEDDDVKAKEEIKPKEPKQKKEKRTKDTKVGTGENQEAKIVMSDEEWNALNLEQLIEIAKNSPKLNRWKMFVKSEKAMRSYVKNNINK